MDTQDLTPIPADDTCGLEPAARAQLQRRLLAECAGQLELLGTLVAEAEYGTGVDVRILAERRQLIALMARIAGVPARVADPPAPEPEEPEVEVVVVEVPDARLEVLAALEGFAARL